MNRRLLISIPGAFVLIAGTIYLTRQRQEISAMREAADAASAATAVLSRTTGVAAAAVSGEGSRAKGAAKTDTAAEPPAISAAEKGEVRVQRFIERIHAKLAPLVDKTAREAAAADAPYKARQTAQLLKLSAAETEALRNHLGNKQGAELRAAVSEWLAQNRGDEAVAAYETAEAARRTAVCEQAAQDAIYRMSKIVDLNPEQKDRLYAGFYQKAVDTPEVSNRPYEVKLQLDLKENVALENPAALAEPLLTPEQLAYYKSERSGEAKRMSESAQGLNATLMASFLEALQETNDSGE